MKIISFFSLARGAEEFTDAAADNFYSRNQAIEP